MLEFINFRIVQRACKERTRNANALSLFAFWIEEKFRCQQRLETSSGLADVHTRA
jgi:hypothetical protein